MFSTRVSCLLLAVSCLIGGRALAEDKHEHDHKAPHGGVLLETGDEAAHLEIVHDAKAGKLTIYVLDSDPEKALAIKDAPKIKLKTDKGNKELETKAVDAKDGAASQYEVTDDALKTDPLKGRISVNVKDKKYNIDIKEDGHKH
jgi:hypothetical protein